MKSNGKKGEGREVRVLWACLMQYKQAIILINWHKNKLGVSPRPT